MLRTGAVESPDARSGAREAEQNDGRLGSVDVSDEANTPTPSDASSEVVEPSELATAPEAGPRQFRQHRFVPPPGACEILVVRHGESEPMVEGRPLPLKDGHGDPALADEGLEQADRIADRIVASGERVAAIYVTTLCRTHQTAAPTAARLGIEPSVEPDLREVFLGEWEGGELRRRVIDADPIAVAMYQQGRWDVIPGAETEDALRARVRAGIDRITAAHPDELVMVVVHGGVIGTIMNLATGSTGFAFTGADNASISHLVVTPDRWIVRCYNDTTHLRERFSTIDEPPPATGIRPSGITF
jgi:probable phosphoglycerate mutase